MINQECGCVKCCAQELLKLRIILNDVIFVALVPDNVNRESCKVVVKYGPINSTARSYLNEVSSCLRRHEVDLNCSLQSGDLIRAPFRDPVNDEMVRSHAEQVLLRYRLRTNMMLN